MFGALTIIRAPWRPIAVSFAALFGLSTILTACGRRSANLAQQTASTSGTAAESTAKPPPPPPPPTDPEIFAELGEANQGEIGAAHVALRKA